jgi:hypothetical protein
VLIISPGIGSSLKLKKYKLKTACCQDKQLLNITFYYHLIEIGNDPAHLMKREELITQNLSGQPKRI